MTQAKAIVKIDSMEQQKLTKAVFGTAVFETKAKDSKDEQPTTAVKFVIPNELPEAKFFKTGEEVVLTLTKVEVSK